MSATSGIPPSVESSPMIGGSSINGNSSHNNSFIDTGGNKRSKNVKGSRQSGSRAPLGRIDPNAKKTSNTDHHPSKRLSKADKMCNSNVNTNTTNSSGRAIAKNVSDSCLNANVPDSHEQCGDSVHVKVLGLTPENGAIRGDSLSSLSTAEEELRTQSIVAASARHDECENRDPMLMDIEEATPVVDPDDSLEYEKEMQMLETFYTRDFETGAPCPHDESAE